MVSRTYKSFYLNTANKFKLKLLIQHGRVKEERGDEKGMVNRNSISGQESLRIDTGKKRAAVRQRHKEEDVDIDLCLPGDPRRRV